MKRFFRVLGGVGLAALAFGCSSGSEEPAPFTSARDLASELAARYGAPFAVERMGGQAFWASPLGDTRSLASSSSEAEAVATDFVQRFGRDFGAGSEPVSVKVVRVDTDETGGFAVRFVQLVPGTEIRITDTGGGIDIASDGTLRSAAAVLVPSGAFPRSAVVTAAEAESAVRRAVPATSFAIVDAPALFARATGNGGASLAFRMTFVADDEGYEAWVDANDVRRIGLTQPRGGADAVDQTMAWPFAAYPFASNDPANLEKQGVPIFVTKTGDQTLLIQQPTASRSKINTVEQKGEGRLGAPVRYDFITSPDGHHFRGSFPIKIEAIAGLPSYVAPANVDAHYNTSLVDLAYRRVVKEGPSRDGVLGALTHANSRVVRKAQTTPDGSTTWVEAIDSVNPRFNASYDPIAGLVAFGDGGPSPLGLILPPSTALDVVGHEWTHAFMTRKTGFALVGEEGAIQEMVSDAVGKTIAIRNGDPVENEIGRRLFFGGGALRSFVSPSSYKAETEVVPDDGGAPTSEMARLPSHVDKMDDGCMISMKVDNGCVHFNAGPGNRAFYLMKEGLKRVSPAAEKDEPRPWLARLESIWFYSAGHAIRAPRGTKSGHYSAVAMQQIDYARRWGASAQKEVACAWFAVGAIQGPALSQRGIICPMGDTTERAPTPPSDCGGRPDGLYCSESTPYSATLCKGGSVSGAQQCASGFVCVRESASSQAAKLDANGAITCEPSR